MNSNSSMGFSSYSLTSSLGFLLLLLLLFQQFQFSYSLTCTSQTFTKNRVYENCNDLPYLNSYIHYNFDSSNSTLDLVFLAPPVKPNGWVAWAINPTSIGMIGSQSLIAFMGENGKMNVKTFNVSSYEMVEESKIDFEVKDMEAEFVNGLIRIYAKMILPKNLGIVVNQVWQVGTSVTDGNPNIHDMKPENLNSKGKLVLVSGHSNTTTIVVVDTGDSKIRSGIIHGILSAVSWGIMFPIGTIIARYLRAFESANPAWFYLHIFCQVSAYVIGVVGWGTGLKLGSESEGIQFTKHRYIGITLFALATLQCFALFIRPSKDHKYRHYWNFYHHGVGYIVVILGIVNVFKGLNILNPPSKWTTAYIILLFVLLAIAILLEVITWIVHKKKKSRKTVNSFGA